MALAVDPGADVNTTKTEASRLAGTPAARTCKASTPPADAPTTMMPGFGTAYRPFLI